MIMIVWSGPITPIFLIVHCLWMIIFTAIGSSLDPLAGKELSFTGLALFMSSPIWWFGGRYINNGENPFEKAKNDQVAQPQFGCVHTLYYVRLEYWAVIWAVGGILAVLAGKSAGA
jgi:hypothetical protein